MNNSNPQFYDVLYFPDHPLRIELGCPDCECLIVTTVDEIKVVDQFVCPDCMSIRNVEAEEIFDFRERFVI